jgi:hypothetical protein
VTIGVKPTPRPPRRIKSEAANDDENNYEEGRLSSFLGNIRKSLSFSEHKKADSVNSLQYPTLKPLVSKKYHAGRASSAGHGDLDMSSASSDDNDENLEDMVEASHILSSLSHKEAAVSAHVAHPGVMIPAHDLHVLSEAAVPVATKRSLSQHLQQPGQSHDLLQPQQQPYIQMPVSYQIYHEESPTMIYFNSEVDPRSPVLPAFHPQQKKSQPPPDASSYDASPPLKQQRVQQKEAMVLQ